MGALMIGLAIALPALVAAAGVAYWAIFRRPLPRVSGRLAVEGPRAEVEVVRDAAGVAHVVAASEPDAAFGVGFLHGQERLWQMELMRRIAAGRLSELVGERGLPVDRLMRRLGLHRVSEAEWHVTHAAGDLRGLLLAYAAGVNAAAQDRPPPAELAILRHRPAPWTPEDSLAVGRLLGLSQARSWEAQLVRARLLKAAGAEVAAEVDATLAGAAGRGGSPLAADGVEAALAGLVADLAAADEIMPLSAWTAASNSWAVAGARTASGRPLLANDPHSALTMPSLWYQVHLAHPDGELSGMSVCGLPFVLLGHNRDIAWGLTNSCLSIQDLYVERFNPHNPLQFDDAGTWQDAVRFREVIRVRGGRAVTEDVLVTRRGPIVSPAVPGRQPPLSLRWVALDSEVDSLGWLMRLNRATGWPAFRAAVASCPSPALALTYADTAGNVGWRVSGFIPRRRPGRGWLPSAGWEPGGEWEGFLSMDEVPEAFNPPGGLVIRANQPIPGGLPGEPLPADRAERIAELLAERRDLTVEDMVAMQADVVSGPARRLRGLLLRHLGGGGARAVAGATDGPGAAPDTGTDATGTDTAGAPAARRALELLTGWDCAVGAGSGAALLYERLVTCLTRRVLGAALGEPLARQVTGQGDLNAALPGGPYLATPTDVVLRLLESGRPAIGAAPDPAAVAALLRDALSEAERETVARHGPDVARWRWGDENRLAFVHPLARAFPALAAVLSRGPLPAGGDLDTVNLSARGADGGVLAGNSGPVYRAVYDLADWSRSRAGHAPGQSGHPGSRGYADMIPGWLAVAPPPLPWGPAPEGRRLILVPAGRSG